MKLFYDTETLYLKLSNVFSKSFWILAETNSPVTIFRLPLSVQSDTSA